MNPSHSSHERLLETVLVLVTAALACVMYFTAGTGFVVLNLFFLPVVLAGFFMGRRRAGLLALFSVVVVTIVSVMDLNPFGPTLAPSIVAVSITLWGAALGLTAILVGTLADALAAKSIEVQEAHVGVVEVLSCYLQSANPDVTHRTKEITRLSVVVARKLRLSPKEIDDIRLASLLIDLENIALIERVVRKVIGKFEGAQRMEQRSICDPDLVQSLGSVVASAFPLLQQPVRMRDAPIGAQLIRTVRTYLQIVDDLWDNVARTPEKILEELRADRDSQHHPAVLQALEEIMSSHRAESQR